MFTPDPGSRIPVPDFFNPGSGSRGKKTKDPGSRIPSPHHWHPPYLKENTRQTDLGLGGGLPSLSGEDGGQDAEDGEALEAELGEGLLVLVHEELAGKEVAGHKLLQAQRLQADTDQSRSREGSLATFSPLTSIYTVCQTFITVIAGDPKTCGSGSTPDRHVFGPLGSGSISQRYGSGSFYH
jgi:hypothetical protein